MENLNLYFENLTNSLKLLAIINQDNLGRIVKEYPKFCDIPFEVCDSYLKAFTLTPQLIDNGYFDLKIIANLVRLYIFVESLIADPSLDKVSEDAFFSDPRWIRISQIAKKILEQIDIPLSYPQFEHL